MAVTPNNMYEFESLYSVLDFIKPLLVEGYPVAIQKIYSEQSVLPSMVKETLGFRVDVGAKDLPLKIFIELDKDDKFKDANLNEYIKVKLTDKGEQFYDEYYKNNSPILDVDDEGYAKFQMWDFMRIFGKHMSMGGSLPCETNVKIQTR